MPSTRVDAVLPTWFGGLGCDNTLTDVLLGNAPARRRFSSRAAAVVGRGDD